MSKNYCLDCLKYFPDMVVHDCNPIKSQPVLMDFITYCHDHPEERFWQALRNWAKVPFILTSEDGLNGQDTFYKEGK